MPPPADEPEALLVMAARMGEATAWTILVERHYLPLRRYLTARSHDSEVGADLTQDVLIAAGDLLHRLPADHLFTPWLYRIAQNHLRRLWRRQKLRRVISLDQLLGQVVALPRALRQADDAEDTERADLVRDALDVLSPTLREALLLNGVAGLTASEVASVLGISRPAAERRISRAKGLFRARYNLLLEEENEA